MGYSYMATAISVKEVGELFASRDDVTLLLMSNPTKDYARYLMELEGTDESDCLSAFGEILRGGSLDNYPAHKYRYAIEAYCYECGTELGSVDTRDDWRVAEFCSRHQLARFLMLDEIDDVWPMEMPSDGDYPLVGCFTHERCTSEAATIKKALGSAPKPDGWEEESAIEALETYSKWFQTAADSGMDLIVFNH